MRATKPANAPVRKIKILPIINAPNVLKKKFDVPLTVARVIPISGDMSGAIKIPNTRKACESSRKPNPKIAPLRRAKIKNS